MFGQSLEKHTHLDRHACTAAQGKCYFLTAAMRLEQPAERRAARCDAPRHAGGSLPRHCPRLSPTSPPSPPFCPRQGSGQCRAGQRMRPPHRSLCPRHGPRGQEMLPLPFGCRAPRPPRALAPEHAGSPGAANSALRDEPSRRLIPGPAAANRQRFSNLAGPNKQLFFPAPGHQSPLTAFPPWSRVCFSP